MATIRDESSTTITDEDGASIADEYGIGAGDEEIVISDAFHILFTDPPSFSKELLIADTYHWQHSQVPILSHTGQHDNTGYIEYNSHDYLRCTHTGGVLVGTYASEVFDIGPAASASRYLVYVIGQDNLEPDIVIVGSGTTWGDKMPNPTTWAQAGATTKTWSQIFNLDDAPSVTMRMYYGTSTPPTSYVDRMEILSAIIPANNRYFQIRITITDPNINVYAYVECYHLKFCTYT